VFRRWLARAKASPSVKTSPFLFPDRGSREDAEAPDKETATRGLSAKKRKGESPSLPSKRNPLFPSSPAFLTALRASAFFGSVREPLLTGLGTFDESPTVTWRSCRPLTRIRLAGRPAKKRTLNRSSRLRERKGQDLGSCSGLVGNAIRVAQPSLSPLPSRLLAFYDPLDPLEFCRQQTFRNPLCWLNVGHQMIADQHERALEAHFSPE
jgi:hypothetical protein